ncbi:MAG: SusC/RagA family TonB-linked outer membrane protein [Chitinophaga sp.]|uniref:SusC/RagA family TonB-linked outer membrane protein n=1 Tax=Chitinophaga sp. TaxID=1869181 RepID=UPI0025C3355D|nr:SusC/RagA family TonB-linked outer membrane protein [Chitinophaga sp.]MBV8253981.1 SusC/RagA family TonB-linked outer membrane protein [Chitinophaga sp.]
MKKSYWWPSHIPNGNMRKLIMRMKLTSVLLCAGFLQLSAHGFSQEKISVDFSNIPIGKLLNVIGKKSDYTFLYKNDAIPDKRITIKMDNAPVPEILEKALNGTHLNYRIMPNNLVVIVKSGETVKTIQIKGIVKDVDGTPLIGVTVKVQGTSKGATTNVKGEYEMEVPENAVLEFSYIGYETKQFSIKGVQNFNVTLSANSSGLNEVVVVGYGTQKRVNLSGAVDNISGKTLENRPITNVGTGLQGLIPNLNIGISSGRSSSAPTFNLRGYTSLSGGDPFILVDNIPFTADEVSRLNPADVESVSVLKDAASAAIYGARAAFGVVLITTKSAKDGRLAVSANANYAVRTIGKMPAIVTDPLITMQMKHDAAVPLYNLYPDAVRAYAAQRSKDPSLPAVIVDPTNPNAWAYYGTTNWLREVYNKTAPAYSGNFSIARGDDKLNYYLSGEYYKQDGMLRSNPDIYNRYNLRAKATYTFNDRFKLGTNTTYTNSVYDAPSNAMDYLFFHNANRTPSLSVPKNPDGTWTSDGAALLGRLQSGGRNNNTMNEFLTNFNGELGLVKDIWSLKADATFRRTNDNTKAFTIPVPYRTGPNQPLQYTDGNQSSASFGSSTVKYNVYNVYSNFHKAFQKHDLTALVGFNQEYYQLDNLGGNRNGLISTSYPTVQLATGVANVSETYQDWAVRGLFYRLAYGYDDKYLVEVNGRRDGSSRFPSYKRWGSFPSASAAWVISKEDFFKPIAKAIKMDFLKFRGSYGSLGDQTFNPYGYFEQMKANPIGTILDGKIPVGVFAPSPVTANYSWQTVRSVNLGVDANFLKERLYISYDRYTRYTEGMFVKGKTLPAVYGAGSPATNGADLKTKGGELTIMWRDQFNIGRDPFSYSIKLAVADSRTFITKYDNPTGNLNDYYKGQQLGEIWGLETEGFFQNADELKNHADQTPVGEDDNAYKFYVGDLKFKDLNHDGVISYGKNTLSDPGDRRIIGNSTPRFPYSVDLNASFKSFDLRIFAQGIGKRDWYPGPSNHYFWGIYAQPWTNVQVKNMDHWTPDNPNAYFPRVKAYAAEDANMEMAIPQTRYLQNASYLRLKNVTLAYTLPKHITEKMKIARLRVYFSAENILTISHLKVNLDPEGLDGSIYPFQKTYSAGVNLNF